MAPIIYNLFPRLVGHMGRWSAHAARAREMGFDWIFVNPIQYPGFSGSLYAVKDFFKLNPIFVPPGCADPMAELRHTLEALHDAGLRVMMDLVINHTAKDSELTRAHPSWFRRDKSGAVISPSAIDPADARKVTVWGDLAEVDNAGSADRQGLWSYWTALVQYYLDLGFDGFRCDAAYKVPARLWEQLLGVARRKRRDVVFAAETLGCRLAEVRQLTEAGFNYLFNSSKWWAFDKPWCLEQHEEFQEIAPSISFPESHDTARLMQESGGLLQVQRQRYALAAVFSEGLLMPIGYELGFTRALDVVRTSPDDWEETGVDLSGFIAEMNRLKRETPVLSVEGHWSALGPLEAPTAVLVKESPGLAPAVLLVNKDWRSPQTIRVPPTPLAALPTGLAHALERLHRPCCGRAPAPATASIALEPAELALLLAT
jgi:starch synthase (maltosyl-transferring)